MKTIQNIAKDRRIDKMTKTRSRKKIFIYTVALLSSMLLAFFQKNLYSEDTILNDWSDPLAYKPNPIIFCHGFASGSPQTWTYMTGEGRIPGTGKDINIMILTPPERLEAYFEKYKGVHTSVFTQSGSPLDLIDLPSDEFKLPALNYKDSTDQQINYSLRFLEKMAFNDPNGSIDTYPTGETNWQGDSRGWADRLKEAINYMLPLYDPQGYDSYGNYTSTGGILEGRQNKAIIICHSMGGLATREYIRTDSTAPYKVDTVITINTPHNGSPLSDLADYGKSINPNPFDLVKVPLGWLVGDVIMRFTGGVIQCNGQAVEDMNPGSPFLTEINTSDESVKPDNIKAYCICSRIKEMANLFLGENAGGDGVVPLSSQKAENSKWVFDKYYQLTKDSGHGEAPNESETYAKVLEWLDVKVPVVEITEPAVDGNGEFDPVENTVTVRGKVLNEFFPADSELTIEYREAGVEEWTEATFQTDTGNKKRLKPTSLWDQWRKNLIGDKVVAEFQETIILPSADRSYQLKITVENPAGLIAQSTISEKLNCLAVVDSFDNSILCIDLDKSFSDGNATVMHKFKLRDEDNNHVSSNIVGIASNAAFAAPFEEKFFWVAFTDGTIRKYNMFGEPVKIDNSEQWTINTGKNLIGLKYLSGGYLGCIASNNEIYEYTTQGSQIQEFNVPASEFTFDVTGDYDLQDAEILTPPVFGYGFILSGSGKRIDKYVDENADGNGYLNEKISLNVEAKAFLVMNDNNSPFYWRFITAGNDNTIRQTGYTTIDPNGIILSKDYRRSEISYDGNPTVSWSDFIDMTQATVPVLNINDFNEFHELQYGSNGYYTSQGGSEYSLVYDDGPQDQYICSYYLTRGFYQFDIPSFWTNFNMADFWANEVDLSKCNFYFRLVEYPNDSPEYSFDICSGNFDDISQVQPEPYFNDVFNPIFSVSKTDLRTRYYEDSSGNIKTELAKLIDVNTAFFNSDRKFVVKFSSDSSDYLYEMLLDQDNLLTWDRMDPDKWFGIIMNATIQMKEKYFDIPTNNVEGICISPVLRMRVNPPTAECNAGETIQFSANGAEPLIWTSSDEAVGTIDAQGIFTSIEPGICQITVTDSLGNSDNSGTITVH